MKYTLEIYLPGSGDEVDKVFESDTPFMAINVGDILNNRLWESGTEEGKILRVKKLEHYIWEAQGVTKHKIGVITEAVNNDESARLN